MNSNRILNLPAPASSTEPARLQDFSVLVATYTDVIWVWQVKKALQSLGHYYTIDNSIEVGPSIPLWVTWTAGTATLSGDSLYTQIKNTISEVVADQVYSLAPGFTP